MKFNIEYEVEADGYKPISGRVAVVDNNVLEEVELIMIPEFDATNIITPNGDGKNDYWEIHDQEKYREFRVNIYSASGEKIHSTFNYENNKWDGTHKGKRIPDGTYFYIITSPTGDMVFKGIINLIN